jgi:hypothetical protein
VIQTGSAAEMGSLHPEIAADGNRAPPPVTFLKNN